MRNVCHNTYHKIFLHYFKCVMYATIYIISSYLVPSTCEVRKLKYCVRARLVKRPDDQCLCTSLSVISDYTITGSTPDFSNAGELTHLPLVPHIRASILDPGNFPIYYSIDIMLKRNFFSFFTSIKSFIASSPMYELLINYVSLFQLFCLIYEL